MAEKVIAVKWELSALLGSVTMPVEDLLVVFMGEMGVTTFDGLIHHCAIVMELNLIVFLDEPKPCNVSNQYIVYAYADKGNPLVVVPDQKEMAIVSVWMQVESQQFDAAAAKLVGELVFKPMFGKETENAAVEEQEAKLAKVLDIYETRLTESKYLGGDCFSLADVHHLPVIKCLMGTRAAKLFESRSHVKAWCADIQARPSWQKVISM